jgi:hypothetical protein
MSKWSEEMWDKKVAMNWTAAAVLQEHFSPSIVLHVPPVEVAEM